LSAHPQGWARTARWGVVVVVVVVVVVRIYVG